MKIKSGALVFVLGCALFIAPSLFANENEQTVLIKVEGLYCPFCAYGIEKHIKKLNGFKKVQVNIKEGTTEITFLPGTKISRSAIGEAVEDAGFDMDGIEWIQGGENK